MKYPHREFYIEKQELDNRKKIYDSPEINLAQPCEDMKELLIINSLGELQLCCWDYLCTYSFGNINNHSLMEILLNSSYMDMRKELVCGNRNKFDLCKRCWW